VVDISFGVNAGPHFFPQTLEMQYADSVDWRGLCGKKAEKSLVEILADPIGPRACTLL
jgi:hypothetical protein|tara:strand:- start:429 stop:602 length:174 start_codon:yes stop_codon:yes gene_type:complete